MKSTVKTTERGWAGHYICADRCRFRRNTLIEREDIKIVVSTVGLMVISEDKSFEPIGNNRHFETAAFHSNKHDTRHHDADVSEQIYFKSDWAIAEVDAEDKANVMHDNVVREIVEGLMCGNKY